MERRAIALSFDDGPSVRTEPILDALRQYDARATFFVSGEAIHGREHVLRRTVAEGHEIGNHTYSHSYPPDLSDDELTTELARTSELIRAAAGVTAGLVRPPYGADVARISRIGGELGLDTTVLWSIDPEDWTGRPADEIVESVVSEAESDSIVLLHDGRGAATTVEAVPRILATLRERGFLFVSISEVLGAPAQL
jgi:peptidoglycan/xylan/chitin deacetylase (PgdA/CDA1 family)